MAGNKSAVFPVFVYDKEGDGLVKYLAEIKGDKVFPGKFRVVSQKFENCPEQPGKHTYARQ